MMTLLLFSIRQKDWKGTKGNYLTKSNILFPTKNRWLHQQWRIQKARMADQDGGDQGETCRWVLFHFLSLFLPIFIPATVQAPKFIREIKEIRIKEGMRGKFEAGFAGNPKPEITWWFNGQQMQNSKNVQIKLREDSSTLTLIDCSFDMAGIYECRAVNDQGNDKCRASLSVNSK